MSVPTERMNIKNLVVEEPRFPKPFDIDKYITQKHRDVVWERFKDTTDIGHKVSLGLFMKLFDEERFREIEESLLAFYEKEASLAWKSELIHRTNFLTLTTFLFGQDAPKTIVDDFRTADWVQIAKYPELAWEKSQSFLKV